MRGQCSGGTNDDHFYHNFISAFELFKNWSWSEIVDFVEIVDLLLLSDSNKNSNE